MRKVGVETTLIAAVLLAGCASGRGAGTSTTGSMGSGSMGSATTGSTTTTGTTTMVSGGDVDLSNGGLWSDGSSSGMWMDTTGAMYMGGRSGRMMGLQPADISGMSNQNIVAHLVSGDSLEVALSQAVLAHAQNQSVKDFAQRMITEHTQHTLQARQTATQDGLTPTPLPGDTVDAAMTSRMIDRINGGMTGSMNMSNNNASSGTSAMSNNVGDRRLMMAEIAMHRHMLQELTMLQPKATGMARQMVDQTIPVVRQHLTDAQSIGRQVGGGSGR